MFAIQRGYVQVVQERGFRLPDRYLEFEPRVRELEHAMRMRREPTVPCNNDLLAENFIEVDGAMRLIDYEYSGNNEPSFELGNIWSESNLSLAQLDELIAHYYGAPPRNKVARARLWGPMSKYGWTLWGSIQDGISDLDFDFWGWAMEKYDRAVAEFEGPRVRAAARRRQAPGLSETTIAAVQSVLRRGTALGRIVLLGHLQVCGLRPLHEQVVHGSDDHDHAERRPQHRLTVQPVPVEVERPAPRGSAAGSSRRAATRCSRASRRRRGARGC